MVLPQSATRRSDFFVTLTLTTAPTAARAEPGPGIDQFRLGRRGWMNQLNWERWGLSLMLPVTTPPNTGASVRSGLGGKDVDYFPVP